MKFLSFILALMSLPVFASTNAGEYGAMFSFNHGSGFQNYQLGTKVIEDQVHDLKVTYDFAKSGGGTGTIILPRPQNAGRALAPYGVIPKGAVVVGCYIDVITAMSGNSGATIALSTGLSAADLKAATGFASYTGIVACIPTGTAASSIKITSDVKPSAAIATATITGGKFNLHIFYVLSD